MTTPSEHPTAPEQAEHGLDQGLGHRPRPPRLRRVRRVGQGLARLATRWRRPRFSRGMEHRPEDPDKDADRRFSEGMERGSPKG